MAIQQIQPRFNFPISRLLPDLGDGVTYYVEAVVRNALTGATIATVPLPSVGNRLYAALWRTPADPNGQGLYVTITNTAYFDAGHTQPATTVYAAESDTYIVFDNYNFVAQMASQIGAQITTPDLDYKKIETIVKKIIAAELKKLPKSEQVDYGPYFKTLGDTVTGAIGAIKMPETAEYPETDLSPVLESIKGSEGRLHERFDALSHSQVFPAQKDMDLESMTTALAELPKMNASIGEVKKILVILQEFQNRLNRTMPELGRYLDHIVAKLEPLEKKQPVPIEFASRRKRMPS